MQQNTPFRASLGWFKGKDLKEKKRIRFSWSATEKTLLGQIIEFSKNSSFIRSSFGQFKGQALIFHRKDSEFRDLRPKKPIVD